MSTMDDIEQELAKLRAENARMRNELERLMAVVPGEEDYNLIVAALNEEVE